MSSFVKEFREFIERGNVMDMAVGIIIGGAFTAIVTALCNNIINPLIVLITGGNNQFAGLRIPINDTTAIDFGALITAIINFLIIALVVFLMVKAFNRMRDTGSKLRNAKGEEVIEHEPTCPYCLEPVLAGATRCPHCAAAFDTPAEPTVEIVEK